MLLYFAMLGYLVTIVVGGISIYEFLKRTSRRPGTILACIALGMLLISAVLTGLSTTQSSVGASNKSTPGGSGTVQGSTSPPVPTVTQSVTQATPTSPPTPTEPIPASAETLPENITLKCDCSDPVVVTITKIVIQPQQNRMIWFLTFYNNSQNGADATFRQFYLEKGDQVTYPTTGDQTIYNATGEGVSTGVSLQAGETQQTTLTFSFVPYKDIPYTLSSDLGGLFNGVLAYKVPFKPEVIQF